MAYNNEKAEKALKDITYKALRSQARITKLQHDLADEEFFYDLLKERMQYITDSEKEAKEAYEAATGECVHNWIYEGHDSHNDYDKCTKCGKVIKS